MGTFPSLNGEAITEVIGLLIVLTGFIAMATAAYLYGADSRPGINETRHNWW